MQPDYKDGGDPGQPEPTPPQYPSDPWTMPGNQPDYLLPVENEVVARDWRSLLLGRGGIIIACILLIIVVVGGVMAMRNQAGNQKGSITTSGQEDENRSGMDTIGKSTDLIVKEALFETLCPVDFEKKPQGGAFVCQKWEEVTEDPYVKFTCPSGYTVRGSGSETDCFKVVGGEIDRKSADQIAYCATGAKLVGSSCQKVTTVSAKMAYRCASGYTLSGKTCSKKTNTGPVKAVCEAGFTSEGSGANTKCQKKTAATKGPTQYRCPTGQKLVQMDNGMQCQTSAQVIATQKATCATGYGPLWSGGILVCVKQAKNATVTAKACPDKYVLSSDQKTCKRIVGATVTGCPGGYEPNPTNTTCVSISNPNHTTTPTAYTCPAGYALILTNKCQRIVAPTAVYTCPTGWKSISGSGADTLCRLIATQKPLSISYSCSAGYTLRGTLCQKAVYGKATATQPFVCTDKDYTLSGSVCVYVKNAKLSCAKGSVTKNGCMYTDSKAATKQQVCSSGYKLESNKCVKKQTVNKLVAYTCKAPYVKSGETMCVRQVGGTAQVAKVTRSLPTCKQSYTLSDGKCAKRTLVTEDLIEGYQCEEGWVLSEGAGKALCVLDNQ